APPERFARVLRGTPRSPSSVSALRPIHLLPRGEKEEEDLAASSHRRGRHPPSAPRSSALQPTAAAHGRDPWAGPGVPAASAHAVRGPRIGSAGSPGGCTKVEK